MNASKRLVLGIRHPRRYMQRNFLYPKNAYTFQKSFKGTPCAGLLRGMRAAELGFVEAICSTGGSLLIAARASCQQRQRAGGSILPCTLRTSRHLLCLLRSPYTLESSTWCGGSSVPSLHIPSLLSCQKAPRESTMTARSTGEDSS
jgi:hypothetical protein